MYYVYVIISEDDVYIGYSNDLKRRMAEHNSGQSRYTKGKVWELVYYEAYKSAGDAKMRERKLKQDGRSRWHLMQRIKLSRSLP
jgi:putative endonuclease